MKKFDFLLVGAGLYNAVMAERLTSTGYKVLIVEKRNTIGGNCASKDINGIDVHLYGPHVFHTSNKEVWDYINQFGEFRQFTHKVLSKYGDKAYSFPINRKTIEEVHGDMLNYYSDLKHGKDSGNLEDWCIEQIGLNFYEMFVKEYTEKQWGCSCSELPASIIKRIPVRIDYNDCYFDDYYQGIPVEGYHQLFFNMMHNLTVHFNCDYLQNKDFFKADKVIYTGPVDAFFDYYYGKLEWRSLNFKIVQEHIRDFQGISVMHYPEKRYDYTRITEFKHFNPFNQAFKKDFTVYAEEYPCKNDEEPYYPIEDEFNIKKYEFYSVLAEGCKNVHFAGRLGTYKYNDMDVTVENALSDFDKIIKGELFK